MNIKKSQGTLRNTRECKRQSQGDTKGTPRESHGNAKGMLRECQDNTKGTQRQCKEETKGTQQECIGKLQRKGKNIPKESLRILWNKKDCQKSLKNVNEHQEILRNIKEC